jgi:hypothetical protein
LVIESWGSLANRELIVGLGMKSEKTELDYKGKSQHGFTT